MDQAWYNESIDVAWLRDRYFSNEKHRISLKKGELLMQTGQINQRLFLVLSGELRGFLEEGNERYEIFRSTENMFAGVYSFFSEDHLSYSTVEVFQDCELAYLQRQDADEVEFSMHFLPVLVHELKMRQRLAQQMYREREAVVQRLFSQEKLTTLGQLAAGLAHELNNAVAMIERKTAFLTTWLTNYLSKREPSDRFGSFQAGVERGLEFGTKEVREARKRLQSEGVDRTKADLLTQLGDFDGRLRHASVTGLEEQGQLMEAGRSLHHIAVAARHAAHVVTSVKELGVKRRQEAQPTDINRTIGDALLLMRAKIGKVHIVEELDHKLPLFMSCSGDLVQVWVNLIQNAAESLIDSKTENPTIHLQTSVESTHLVVRVSDNGPGIPPELQDKVFEPNVTTKVSGLSFGLGLGLSIVNKVVEAYNGHITMSSKPGQTVFSTFLPLRNGEVIHHQR